MQNKYLIGLIVVASLVLAGCNGIPNPPDKPALSDEQVNKLGKDIEKAIKDGPQKTDTVPAPAPSDAPSGY